MAYTLLVPDWGASPFRLWKVATQGWEMPNFRGLPTTFDSMFMTNVIRIEGVITEVPGVLSDVPIKKYAIVNGHAPADQGSPDAHYPHPEWSVEGWVDTYQGKGGTAARSFRVQGASLEMVRTLYDRLRRGEEQPKAESSWSGAKLSDDQIEELRCLMATVLSGESNLLSATQVRAVHEMARILDVPRPVFLKQ